MVLEKWGLYYKIENVGSMIFFPVATLINLGLIQP